MSITNVKNEVPYDPMRSSIEYLDGLSDITEENNNTDNIVKLHVRNNKKVYFRCIAYFGKISENIDNMF